MPLFLLFWNLAALWHERYPDKAIKGLLPPETADGLLQIVKKRLNKKLNDEKRIQLYTMAGLLGYICPDLMPRLRDAVRYSLKHTKYLLEPSLELTFVPAFFSMLGLSLNYPFRTLFTPERCQILVNKANEYEQSCRLIEKFVRFLQVKID